MSLLSRISPQKVQWKFSCSYFVKLPVRVSLTRMEGNVLTQIRNIGVTIHPTGQEWIVKCPKVSCSVLRASWNHKNFRNIEWTSLWKTDISFIISFISFIFSCLTNAPFYRKMLPKQRFPRPKKPFIRKNQDACKSSMTIVTKRWSQDLLPHNW